MGNCERDLDEETIYGVQRLGCENEARNVTFCNRRCRYPITYPLELAGRAGKLFHTWNGTDLLPPLKVSVQCNLWVQNNNLV